MQEVPADMAAQSQHNLKGTTSLYTTPKVYVLKLQIFTNGYTKFLEISDVESDIQGPHGIPGVGGMDS